MRISTWEEKKWILFSEARDWEWRNIGTEMTFGQFFSIFGLKIVYAFDTDLKNEKVELGQNVGILAYPSNQRLKQGFTV